MVLGCTVGSFLNVVCLRLPKMMERDWHVQCCELLDTPVEPSEPFNLAFPASRCPQCGHNIRAWENIPVISYVFLRGRCSGCQTPISKRYPLVEFACGLLSAVVAWHFGATWQCAAALGLTWALLTLAIIDFDTQLLPDDITLPLLWAGLLLSSLAGIFAPLQDAVIGAMAGYLILWCVYWLFKLITGREGMGYGDFKLLAALGAWLGWQALPQIILLSSLVGAVFGIAMIIFRGRDRQIPMPFGPYLASAGWISLLYGSEISHWYMGISGLGR
ncbi:MAG TPA: A24 family peptidase [Pseudomonadales bacterium]|nr:A24 family peptidase [Pseudomonadales bacterium]